MKPGTFNSGKAIFSLIFIFSAMVFFSACSKSNNNTSPPPSQNAFVSVTNVSPTTSTYTVFSDTTNIYPAGTLGYGSTTGISGGNPYETIVSGNHTIKLTSGNNSVFLDSNASFASNGYYSFFVYDTGQVKTLALKDNLTPPASGNSEVRFLNFSSNSQLLNTWLVNNDTTIKDSIPFANVGYVGSGSVSADSLASFKTITAGTYKVLVNSSSELNLFTDSVTFVSGKIYTVYAKGYLNAVNPADSLSVGVIQNY